MPVKLIEVNEEEINGRLKDLDSLLDSTKYSKQKGHLQTELEIFLLSMCPKKFLFDALPSDIRKFLVFKDSKGKTQVHIMGCGFKGRHGFFTCGCPLRCSVGYVDSLIGKLRAIFRDIGRGTEWSDSLRVGNPACAPLVKRYLRAVSLEQSASAVVPKKATPLFIDKLSCVLRHISFQVRNPKLSLLQRFVLRRDMTFFNLLAFTGDRAGDLGNLLASQICYLPDNSGVIFTLTKGKTVSVKDPREVILFYSPLAEFCPAQGLVDYLHFCAQNNLLLSDCYVFRPLNHKFDALNHTPFTSSSANARLKIYLQRLGIWNGETPHSTRSACALTLLWLGIDSEKIKDHVGWKSDTMLQHYTAINHTSNKEVTAKALSSLGLKDSAKITSKIDLYKNGGCLKKVVQLC